MLNTYRQGFSVADGWFAPNYNDSVWPAKVNTDSKVDLLGVHPNGTPYKAISNGGNAFEKMELATAIFPNNSGWINGARNNRVWPADINGDGKTDFIGIANNGSIYTAVNSVNINGEMAFDYMNYSGGSGFEASVWFDSSHNNRVWVEDMNGDGKTDIVGINNAGNVCYALSNGNGTFGNMQTIPIITFPTASGWFNTGRNNRVWAMDINGDKRADFVGIDDGGSIYTFINNGDFTFSVRRESVSNGFVYKSGWFNTSINTNVWPEDYNGDGKIDIVAIDSVGKIWYSLSKGDGYFETVKSVSSGAFATSSGWFNTSLNDRVWAADITGDKKTDFIGIADDGKFYTINNGSFGIRNVSGDGGFPAQSGWFSTARNDRVWLADINADGRKDIVAMSDSGEIYYALASGTGTLGNRNQTSTKILSESWFSLSKNNRVWAADVTGDGRDDIVAVANNGSIYVSKASDSSTYGIMTYSGGVMCNETDVNQLLNTQYNTRMWPADINGDKKVDIVAIDNSGNIWYALSKGNGLFENYRIISGSVFPSSSGWFSTSRSDRVWPADVNGDGYIDFVGVDDEGVIYTFVNYCNYTFSTRKESAKGITYGSFLYESGCFDPTINNRIWPITVNSDKKTDFIGIDNFGIVHYILATSNGLFANDLEQISAHKNLQNQSTWFSKSYKNRFWPADVDGNGKTNFVGVGLDGYIYVSGDMY